MDIAFKCPSCHQELEVDVGAAGQQIACPACGKPMTIPQADANNLKVGIAAHSSAAAKEEKHFSVPVTENPVQPLIKKALPSLEAAANGNLWFDPVELRHALDVFEALYLDHILLEESIAYPQARQRLAGLDTVGMGREMARRRVLRQAEALARAD